jgi:hypothetical protein
MTAVVAASLSWSLQASAQTAAQDTVSSRTGPHTTTIGMVVGPFGSFLLSPQFILDTVFTDNLFATKSDKSADIKYVFKPSFSLSSDWVNHSLKISAKADQSKHVDNIGENALNYGLDISGRLDALTQSNLTASVNFGKTTSGRGDPNDVVAGVIETEQTISTKSTIKLGGLYNENVISVKLDVIGTRTDFDDAGETNNDDRDSLNMKTTARVGYAWVPGAVAFIEATHDLRHFDRAVDGEGFKRSSRGYEVLLGGVLDFSAVTFVELGIGYIKQDFGKQKPDVQKLGPTKGFSFKGSLIWNPTDLMTITGNMRRTVNETTLAGASSALTSTFGLRADYGLLKELLLSAESTLEIQSFDGIGQVDKLLKIDLGGKYFIGPYFIANIKYTYEERFADDSSGSFLAYPVNAYTYNI